MLQCSNVQWVQCIPINCFIQLNSLENTKMSSAGSLDSFASFNVRDCNKASSHSRLANNGEKDSMSRNGVFCSKFGFHVGNFDGSDSELTFHVGNFYSPESKLSNGQIINTSFFVFCWWRFFSDPKVEIWFWFMPQTQQGRQDNKI